jgi:3D (Asp-Asp-Asp) domain-containing protein
MPLSIRDAQVALTKLGYFDGAADGDYADANFRDDLRRFQRDYPACGAADGWYGPKTDAVLAPLLERLKRLAPAAIVSMRRWQLTYYYVGSVRAHGTAGGVPLYSDKGEVLARVPAGAFVEASLEGSSLLVDGRLINVAGWRAAGVDAPLYKPVLELARRNKWLPEKPGYAGLRLTDDQHVREVRTFAVRAPGPKGWPICARGIECDPFRTIAADNGRLPRHDKNYVHKGGVVPAGTRVFCLELAGVRLPDGSTHDGRLTVNDTGGGIFGAHFDVFTGVKALADRLRIPHRAHIWFEGIEARLPFNYEYGL